MLSYTLLNTNISNEQIRQRTGKNLHTLRTALSSAIPSRTLDEHLILGTWNIRNFDDNRFQHGPRLEEAFFYLAEIISAFDVIAIQEINTDIAPLQKLMTILGPDYRFLITDTTEGAMGNRERLGFIYNTRKVSFTGIAGEIVLPDNLLISKENHRMQFSRTPFCASFESGWFKFMFATVHIYYGNSSKTSTEYKTRVAEIQTIADILFKRAREQQQNYILVGDFNIDAIADDAYNALEKSGFTVFKNRIGSNSKQNKFFDQISYVEKSGEIELATPAKAGTTSNGVFNFFDFLFTDEQFDDYDPVVKRVFERWIKDATIALENAKAGFDKAASKNRESSQLTKIQNCEKTVAALHEKLNSREERLDYYKNIWRTFQLSDHFPLWVTLKTDFTDRYLQQIS